MPPSAAGADYNIAILFWEEKLLSSLVNRDINSPLTPPSSRGPGRSPFKAKTGVRIPVGAPNRIHLEPHQLGVEHFLEMLRFEQRSKLEELPITLR